jgi:hypothetical protein
MTKAEKYLGVSKLTAEYDGNFFNDDFLKDFKIEIGKVLKSSEKEIIFITSEKYNGIDIYFIKVLARFEGTLKVMNWTEKVFPSSDNAIKYYENSIK